MKTQIQVLALLFALSIQLTPSSQTVLADNDKEFGVVGIVLTDDGTALSGVLISVYEIPSGSRVKISNTDSGGFFGIYNLPSGSYNLVFEKKGYVSVTKTISSVSSPIELGYVQMPKALQLSTTTSSRVASPGE